MGSPQDLLKAMRAKSGGKPLDPLARFHLGNGARLERLNFLGDTSAKSMREAAGLMVNYLYELRCSWRSTAFEATMVLWLASCAPCR